MTINTDTAKFMKDMRESIKCKLAVTGTVTEKITKINYAYLGT